jgi:very-short-patch-repair endonuclease
MATIETIRSRLERSRRDLLDLSSRNRLISTPRGQSKSRRIEIVDELSDEVFRLIVRERKTMSFLPGLESAADYDGDTVGDQDQPPLYQPDAEELAEGQIAERHTDARLQTALTSAALQKRLLNTFYDARTFEEEQGVNILYLAMGFLQWFEAAQSDRPRFAPLLLIPVDLERQTAGSRFRVRLREEDITTNLSLQEKLKDEFNVCLPDISDIEDVVPSSYFAAVREAVKDQARWDVLPNDMVLWFFSFAKFLMYRDLQPEHWPAESSLESNPVIASLLEEGFRNEPPICGDDDKIDPIIPPEDLVHVVDADSSQAVAIEEVRRGRHLVIQGPPGTGKSQTIANMIALAVKENKTVLFVAEKMAALEVVKRRLDNAGLGDMCLELHSHKANKRTVVQDVANTLQLGRPKLQATPKIIEQLTLLRDKLNNHAEILHRPLPDSRISPFQAIGSLVKLRARGVPPADFELLNAKTWTPGQRSQYVDLLQDLVLHMREIGIPARHPWRGTTIKAILPTDVDRLKPRLEGLIGHLDCLIASTGALAAELHVEAGDSALQISTLARLAQRLATAPDMDRASIADTVWHTRREAIRSVVAAGMELESCRQSLEGIVTRAAWSTDVNVIRRHLAAYGRSWLRWLNRDYRAADASLRGLLQNDPPKAFRDRVNILDKLVEGQEALWNVAVKEGDAELGQRAFGSRWRGAESDWSTLQAIDRWETETREARVPPIFREMMARSGDMSQTRRLLKQIAADLKPAMQDAQTIFHELGLNLEVAFDNGNLHAIPFEALKARAHLWCQSTESLSKWIHYHNRLKYFESLGMRGLTDLLVDGSITPDAVADRFQMAYYEQIMREVIRVCPALAEFNGQSHQRLVESFRNCDELRIAMARHEVALAHHANIPQDRMGIGEVGTVQREVEKKRKHLPVRQLIKQAGHAIQAIKPVFMMSPISVAQFLEPGHLSFDLLLIDEASQVNPVDALGAIARSRQAVVVGDEKQLPPTHFFDKVLADDEGGEGEEFSASDVESILGLCSAQGMPKRMLRWHYRSNHHSLIAVSNREFYGDRLFVIPSAVRSSDELGLFFRHVPEGVFDRGGSATNRIEAAAVAKAIMEHARRSPGQSLGVGAFSVTQRDAILDELERLRRHDTSCEAFFATGGPYPFFVKNLENIQGDERDVIFISVGYSRDADGYLTMSFGPLQTNGGERRLNVLISRARDRCEVFSSITADEIDLSRARSRGAQALKTFLAFAKTGILDVGVATGEGYDSDFEAEVARALAGYGFEVHPQVGIAGFFIDLAVVDPDMPGRYLLGIECDGASYHSSRSARDRDRLRENVLRNRGWIIHRIWSTDWFHRPDEQLRKALGAIDDAKREWASRNGSKSSAESIPAGHQIERVIVPPTPDGTIAVPYEEASFHEWRKLDGMQSPDMQNMVLRILEIEGPIHVDELARRVVDLTGGKRVGIRSSEAVVEALRILRRLKKVNSDGSFHTISDQVVCPIRNRADVNSRTLREPQMIPPAEIRAAMIRVVAAHCGATTEEAITTVARTLGFAVTSAQLRSVLERQIARILNKKALDCRDGKLYPVAEKPEGI